jgi:hypothetical protein
MSKENNLTDFLTDVADAIREKKGTSEKINPQNFSEEIRGIEAGSPFAVDFGEEIATGNPAFLGALQEDIDYYNEVVRSIESGERTEGDYLTGELAAEFKEKIAWWPSGMTYKTNYDNFFNIKEMMNMEVRYPSYSINGFYNCFNLISFIGDTSNVETFTRFFAGCPNLRKVEFDANKIKDINSGQLYNLYKLRKVFVKNIKQTFQVSNSRYVSVDSVKYILENCQARADGAAYTLALHADVLARFMNKCTEGHEEYDAEYAASLASANEKGLTLA